MSNVRSWFLPIRPGKPFSPYAIRAGMVSFARSPTDSCATPAGGQRGRDGRGVNGSGLAAWGMLVIMSSSRLGKQRNIVRCGLVTEVQARDDLLRAELELEGLSTVAAAVKSPAILQEACIMHCHRVARARVVDAVSGSKYLHLDVSTHIFRSLSPSLVRNTTFNSAQRHYSSQDRPSLRE